jgi:DinB superfamily
MDTAERATILGLLGESSKALEGVVAGVTEEQAKQRPASGGWTIAEVVEHVALGEEQMFFALTERFRPLPPTPPNEEKEKRLMDAVLNRDEKRISPEMTRPTGRFGTLSAALSHFRACRAKTIHYVEQCRDDQRCRSVKHPMAGIITGYEYLLILSTHPSRHAVQIRELRAALD